MPTILENEVIESPRSFRGEHFRGVTTLAYDARVDQEDNAFHGCIFEGPGRSEPGKGGRYAIRVPPWAKPRASLVTCDIHNADKGVFGQFLGLFGGAIHDCADGIFSEIQGHLHVEGTLIERLGGQEGDHADGIQVEGGGFITVRRVIFNLADVQSEGFFTNSCVFLESKFAPVERVVVTESKLIGGNYLVYCVNDGFGPPSNVTLSGNFGSAWKSKRPVYTDGPIRQVGNSWQELRDA